MTVSLCATEAGRTTRRRDHLHGHDRPVRRRRRARSRPLWPKASTGSPRSCTPACTRARASASSCRSAPTTRAPTGVSKVAPSHQAGKRIVLVARLGGSNRRDRAARPRHDAEPAPSRRSLQGSGRSEAPPRRRGPRPHARDRGARQAAGRWLITLDTAGDAAEALYRSLGYRVAGAIPFYARDAFEDRYDATRLMYKDLRRG